MPAPDVAGLAPADAALAVDVLVRLAISHAALPGAAPAEAAAGLAAMLGPFIDRAMTAESLLSSR